MRHNLTVRHPEWESLRAVEPRGGVLWYQDSRRITTFNSASNLSVNSGQPHCCSGASKRTLQNLATSSGREQSTVISPNDTRGRTPPSLAGRTTGKFKQTVRGGPDSGS